jgi:hypothetical protein
MIEAIADMPAGTIGVRISGKATAAEYTDVLMPILQQAVDEHGEVRLVVQVGPDFDRFTAGMIGADATKGLGFGLTHWSAWKRLAVVADVEWLRHAMQAFGWMAPGEARLFGLDELQQAKDWVAG